MFAGLSRVLLDALGQEEVAIGRLGDGPVAEVFLEAEWKCLEAAFNHSYPIQRYGQTPLGFAAKILNRASLKST